MFHSESLMSGHNNKNYSHTKGELYMARFEGKVASILGAANQNNVVQIMACHFVMFPDLEQCFMTCENLLVKGAFCLPNNIINLIIRVQYET
jgi:hypothetical protein